MKEATTSSGDNKYYKEVLDCRRKLIKYSESSRNQIDNKYLEEENRLMNGFLRLSEDVLSFLKQNSWKDYYRHLVVGIKLTSENIEARISEMLKGKDFSRPLYVNIPEHKQEDLHKNSAELVRLYHSYEGRYGLESLANELDFSMLIFSRHYRMHPNEKYISEVWLYRPLWNGVVHFNTDLAEKCNELIEKFLIEINKNPNNIEVVMRLDDGRLIGMHKIKDQVCIFEYLNGEWIIPAKTIKNAQLATGTLTSL